MPGRSTPAGLPLAPWAPPAALCLVTLAGALAASTRAPSHGPVAAVFPPWWNAAGTIAAASRAAPVLGLGGAPFVAIAAPAAASGRAALWHAGAWLLLDAAALGGCRPIPAEDAK